MTRIKFGIIIAYLESGCGKSLTPKATDVYFDLLGDLDAEVLRTAARRVLLEHRWATFPSIAELREAAAETQRGEVATIPPAKAWEIAWAAAGKIDLDMTGPHWHAGTVYPSQAESVLADVPPEVREAMKAYGLPALCYGAEPVGVIRAQFSKIYEQLASTAKRQALIPAAMKGHIEAIGRACDARLPDRTVRQIQTIGKEEIS